MTTLGQLHLAEELPGAQAGQARFPGMVLFNEDLHFARHDHTEMIDRLPLLEDDLPRRHFLFFRLAGSRQHLWVAQVGQRTRHRLVNDLAIREDDRLIRSLRNGRIMRDDQDRLSTACQAFEQVENVIGRSVNPGCRWVHPPE